MRAWDVVVTLWPPAMPVAETSPAFDHASTGWPLVGKHPRVLCTTCHATAVCKGPQGRRRAFARGGLSRFLRSRRPAVAVFLAMTATSIILYCTLRGLSATGFYVICGLLGLSLGYWAVFVTIASEQFGTNLRATATTTVPNWVRGALVPITFAFEALHERGLTLVHSALVLGLSLVGLASLALYYLPESFGRDLDFEG